MMLLLLATASVSIASGRDAEPDLKEWLPRELLGVEDMLQIAVIGDPKSLDWNEFTDAGFSISPDRRRVALIVRRGNPAQGTNDAEILIYEDSNFRDGSAPRVVARLASSTNHQPIAFMRWLSADTLAFAGSDGDALPQVYRVDLANRSTTRLTNLASQLLWFDISPRGDLVTFNEIPASPPAQSPECRRFGCRVSAETVFSARDGITLEPAEVRITSQSSREAMPLASPRALHPEVTDCDTAFTGGLSPSGEFGLRWCRVSQWPEWWRDYRVPSVLVDAMRQRNQQAAVMLFLTDFRDGKTYLVSEAPALFAWGTPAIWIDDKTALFVGALEPLTHADPVERKRRAEQLAILSFNPYTRRIEHIAALPKKSTGVKGAVWDAKHRSVKIEMADASGKATASQTYRQSKDQWKLSARASAGKASVADNLLANGLNLDIEQSINASPKLVVRDSATSKTRTVLDPNGFLAAKKLAHVEKVTWKLPSGTEWSGGLYYPPDYVPGRRYPLVIQTHGFSENIFAPYGATRNFAAQPIAAKGIFVLQVAEGISKVVGTPLEWTEVQQGYEGAIDMLVKRELIDPDRVGIIGWSRTGPHVGYTLTHSDYSFAAAAFTDTADFGWWYYIATGADRAQEIGYGAVPLGEGLDDWQKFSPTFNLERVRTPMLMWEVYVEGVWDWYVGLRRLKKPVEYWYLPDGTHELFQISQRLKTNQLLVDWFQFWLKNEEDSASSKADQYKRWRAMRSSASLHGTSKVP